MNKIKILNNTTLKLIAISLMLIDHIGLIFFKGNTIFLKIGEVAFPLFAFCVSEGFYYTKNRKKYLRNLFLFAIISELFFDFALYNKVYWLHQNVLFTLSLSVLFLMIYEQINNSKYNPLIKNILICLSLFIILLISTFCFTDHNPYGILLIFIFYIFRDKPILKYVFSSILLFICFPYKFALLSIPILLLYNGKKGYNLKYFFYTFYPIHLLILYIIKIISN